MGNWAYGILWPTAGEMGSSEFEGEKVVEVELIHAGVEHKVSCGSWKSSVRKPLGNERDGAFQGQSTIFGEETVGSCECSSTESWCHNAFHLTAAVPCKHFHTTFAHIGHPLTVAGCLLVVAVCVLVIDVLAVIQQRGETMEERG